MQPEEQQISVLFFTAGLIILFFVGAIILFVITYQKRVLKQERDVQELKLKHQENLLKATVESRENEQQRIAQDLHDDIGAILSTARLQISSNPQLAELDGLMFEGMEGVRRIVNDLLPPTLKEYGLKAALEERIKSVESNSEIKINLEYFATEDLLEKEREILLFRILQECLNNSIKYADCNRISIEISDEGSHLHVLYRDNGKGFDMESTKKNLGLHNIQSRADVLRAQHKMYSEPTKGFSLTLEIPLTS